MDQLNYYNQRMTFKTEIGSLKLLMQSEQIIPLDIFEYLWVYTKYIYRISTMVSIVNSRDAKTCIVSWPFR